MSDLEIGVDDEQAVGDVAANGESPRSRRRHRTVDATDVADARIPRSGPVSSGPLRMGARRRRRRGTGRGGDPYDRPGRWFVVHTYAGTRTRSNRPSEPNRVDDMEDRIYEVVIPMEDVVEFKNGKKSSSRRRSFPATCSHAATGRRLVVRDPNTPA